MDVNNDGESYGFTRRYDIRGETDEEVVLASIEDVASAAGVG